ncbi:MAG: glycosyltransferase family 4 protein [Acidobacteriota bacterium]|nr:glycosyltransferase family 4 protein [Acidobacteriota bacterium]
MKKKRIAVLAPDLSIPTGISVVAKFLYDVINNSGRFEANLISVATSANDQTSVRLANPSSWTRGASVSIENYEGVAYRHIGANLTEIEFQRYRPRKALNKVLNEFDLVQIVAGSAPWLLAAKDFGGHLAISVFSKSKVERESVIRRAKEPKKTWLKLMTQINSSLERKAFQRADRIFVNNIWLKDELEKEFSEKTILAPPGIDTDFFTPIAEKKADYILSVGRFSDPRKNVRMLFRAYKILNERFSETPKLVLAGQTAPTEDDLAEARRLGISEKVEIITGVSRERLRELYQNAGLFVLSSDEEGFGLIIAEAMSCGLAVVSTDCGGPEILVLENETGFLTPVGDAAALAEKIQVLLTNAELCEKMGAAGRRRAEEKFSQNATGKIYLETYEQLLNR